MKKLLCLLVVGLCVSVALAAASKNPGACSGIPDTPMTVILKGTITEGFDWFSLGGEPCAKWVNETDKHDAYLLICYNEVDCTVCTVTVTQADLWIVDKDDKVINHSVVTDSLALICMSVDNVGGSMSLETGFTASIAGKRDCKWGIKNLAGKGVLINPSDCTEGGELATYEINLRRDDTLTSKAFGSFVDDPFCPNCTPLQDACSNAMELVLTDLAKRYKNYEIIDSNVIDDHSSRFAPTDE